MTGGTTKAVRCYSVKRGDFWRGQCVTCGWSSGDLPFDTRAEAEHCTDLHLVLCKGAKAQVDQPPSEAGPSDEDRRRARLLAEGGGFDSDVEDLFARGISVVRAGGDVEAFLREQLKPPRA